MIRFISLTLCERPFVNSRASAVILDNLSCVLSYRIINPRNAPIHLVAFQGLATPPSGGATMGAGAIPHRPARPAMRRGAMGSRGSARIRLRFWVSDGARISPLGGWGKLLVWKPLPSEGEI